MLDLHALIKNNREYPYYGSLLQHHDLQNPKILHCSVQLNDYDSLAWEPINPGREKDAGRLVQVSVS